MNAYIWASLGAVLGLMLSLLYLRRRQGMNEAAGPGNAAPAESGPGSTTALKAKPRSASPFHGVTLKPCLEPCEAVQAIVGQRFLSQQAPALPLAGCDQKRCDCTYKHFGDRRQRGDRRSGWDTFGGFSQTLIEGDRRDEDSDRRDDG
jgi:hypothetical protein